MESGLHEAVNTDELRSAYQVPFGLSVAYNFGKSKYAVPYIGAKTGAMFARYTSYFGTGGVYDKSWGFAVSPEIGINIYPTGKHWGFHVAGYYSYSTNDVQTLDGKGVDNISGAGFRLGVIF